MFEQYKRKISLRSRIIANDLQTIYRSYQRKEHIYSFFDTLLELLKEDSFLALDPTFIEKLRNICTMLLFRFPKDNELRILRKRVIRELSKQEKNIQQNREEIVQNLIEKERYERRIPFDCMIGEKELLEMYKQDFNNCLAIQYSDVSISSLFYFLTTVHKIHNFYPIYIQDNIRTISSTIRRSIFPFFEDFKLNNYIQYT